MSSYIADYFSYITGCVLCVVCRVGSDGSLSKSVISEFIRPLQISAGEKAELLSVKPSFLSRSTPSSPRRTCLSEVRPIFTAAVSRWSVNEPVNQEINQTAIKHSGLKHTQDRPLTGLDHFISDKRTELITLFDFALLHRLRNLQNVRIHLNQIRGNRLRLVERHSFHFISFFPPVWYAIILLFFLV